MPKEVIVALIALSGVALSGLVSWLVSRRSIAGQLRGVRLQLQQSQMQLLQQTRLSEYGEIYQAVRGFVRFVQQREATFERLKSLQSTVTAWDLRNGLVLGAEATGVVYRYERLLRSLVERGETAFANRLESREKRLGFIRRCFEVEIALKNDVGIYQIEFAEPGTRFKSYGQIATVLERSEDDGNRD